MIYLSVCGISDNLGTFLGKRFGVYFCFIYKVKLNHVSVKFRTKKLGLKPALKAFWQVDIKILNQ